MLRKVPIIVILGSTGTGKTKLSIELAQKFGGEIISADSMQVYRGLDIVTAKASAVEQASATHHLLDVATAGKPFTVVDFRDAALPIAETLLAKQKIPIVVGGTNYYIESLLWKVLVNPPPLAGSKRKHVGDTAAEAAESTEPHSTPSDVNKALVKRSTNDELSAMDSERLHDLLRTVDPETAQGLHPNNRRKVIRALEIYRDVGIPMSQVIRDQQNIPGGSCLGGPLRYDHVILFWLRCDQTVLNSRLDARIDDMVAQGLLREIRQFYDALDEVNNAKDYTKGIMQTIGFKEFIPYLEKFDKVHDEQITAFMTNLQNSVDQQDCLPEGLTELRACLEELRLVTKRYSKKQLKWISNRFLAETDRQVPPVYGLDSSRPTDWKANVYQPAVDVIQAYMEERPSAQTALPRHVSARAGLSENVTNVCDTCQRQFIGEFQWRIHLGSNKHKRAAAKKKRMAETSGCSVVT